MGAAALPCHLVWALQLCHAKLAKLLGAGMSTAALPCHCWFGRFSSAVQSLARLLGPVWARQLCRATAALGASALPRKASNATRAGMSTAALPYNPSCACGYHTAMLRNTICFEHDLIVIAVVSPMRTYLCRYSGHNSLPMPSPPSCICGHMEDNMSVAQLRLQGRFLPVAQLLPVLFQMGRDPGDQVLGQLVGRYWFVAFKACRGLRTGPRFGSTSAASSHFFMQVIPLPKLIA